MVLRSNVQMTRAVDLQISTDQAFHIAFFFPHPLHDSELNYLLRAKELRSLLSVPSRVMDGKTRNEYWRFLRETKFPFTGVLLR